MGSAVDAAGISAELEAFRAAGLGGVEITPIYGVMGTEPKFVPYLSTEWVTRLEGKLREAARLDLGVDMATGTGWPFGGPGFRMRTPLAISRTERGRSKGVRGSANRSR